MMIIYQTTPKYVYTCGLADKAILTKEMTCYDAVQAVLT